MSGSVGTPREICVAGRIDQWDVEAGEWVGEIGNYVRGIAGLGFGPDGTWLASAGYNSVVRVWPVLP